MLNVKAQKFNTQIFECYMEHEDVRVNDNCNLSLRPDRLATDVPFIACVINLPCTFNHYLDMSSLQFCFMIWIVVF